MRRYLSIAMLATLTFLGLLVSIRAQQPLEDKGIEDDGMSTMGHLALVRARAREFLRDRGATEAVQCDDNGCETGEEDIGPASTQAETTIAIDPTGVHVVVGFNDFRGFNLNPLSLSGYAYSDDGGVTWVDGGQLPVTANGQLSNGTMLPQVSGDPDVKNVGGCNFIYSSILVKGYTGNVPNFTGTATTMSIHRSVDCGHTWTGPFEVTAATNPHGALSGNNARDSADKEFIDVDPDTGRVLMSWSNFSSSALTGITSGVEIRTTFSDDILTGSPPTWSTGVVLNPASPTFDQGSVPRFARNGSNNVYVAWSSSSLSAFASNIRVVTSTDNGQTWGAPVTLNASDFFPIDQIVGNDRVHSFPGMAVGPEGNVYVTYANNNSHDGSDIAFQRSTNGGVSFSAPIFLNSRAGSDRSQWFPYVTVDPGTGRVYVTFYSQAGPTGDLATAIFSFSDDGGLNWRASPLMSTGCVGIGSDPLDCRPFHAGYGNDTSQPNLGDYIGATTFNGFLYAVWAATYRQGSFVDGQPNASFTTPDFYVNKVNTAKPALAATAVTFTDSGGNGFVDAGDQVSVKLPLTNLATAGVTYTNVTGVLTTTTPGVTILAGTRTYPDIPPGTTQTNTQDFVYRVSPTFVPGTKIEFSLNVITAQGSTNLLHTQNTGTPIATTIFAENFNGASPGSLPSGWTTIHVGGTPTVPWTTNNTFCGTASNALFHINANDGTTTPTRFERVASPNITIPANSQYVTLDFDVCYDTEDDPNFNVLAYDGADLRITDFTTGHFARAVFVEAFAEVISTGGPTGFLHYPKHAPRSGNPNYFQDISMWAGDSQGFKHVFMRLPGMEGTTVQLRPDFTQDGSATCTDVRPTHTTCGVMIDNIVMRSVVTKSDELQNVTLTPVPGSPGVYTGRVTSQAVAAAGGIAVSLSGSVSAGTITISPLSVTIPAGSQTSPSFTVTVSPANPGITGTVTATGPSNSRSAGIRIL